ncbi:MAG: prepilin peptidase [Burkholderiaceae bacterium]|jgi:leader peptidase (prepilin peptidase)/N-methyltransferase
MTNDVWSLLTENWIAASMLFGLLTGSFLNVVVARMPSMLKSAWERDIADYQRDVGAAAMVSQPEAPSAPRFNLVTPRSRCPHCQHAISGWQNIPLLSYLWLRGRCAHCHAPISWRYPSTELLTAVLFGLVAWRLPAPLLGLAHMSLVAGLVALALIDLDTYLLPDDITLPWLWLGLLVNATIGVVPLHEAVWGAAIGYMSLWTVYQVFKLLTGKEGIGYGDFKLLALLGAWFGWASLPAIILLASASGAVIGLLSLKLRGKTKDHPIPFGPFLVLGGISWLLDMPARDWLDKLFA